MSSAQQSLQDKIEAFQMGLTDQEQLRLRQLRSVDESGVPLIGISSWEARIPQHPEEDPSREVKQQVNSALRAKLRAFEDSLDKEELAELLVQLAGNSLKHQSSFGVECRTP